MSIIDYLNERHVGMCMCMCVKLTRDLLLIYHIRGHEKYSFSIPHFVACITKGELNYQLILRQQQQQKFENFIAIVT